MKKRYFLFLLFFCTLRVFSQSCQVGNCPNLVVNGDFNLGNTGFTSSLIYNTVGTAPSFNHYYVSDDAYIVYGNWAAQSPDTTNFMICDGSNIPGALVWSQSIPAIQGGGPYHFCLMLTNLDINHNFTQPDLQFLITDQNGDTLLIQQSGPVVPQNSQFPPVYVWTAYSYSFNALPGSTSCTVQISQLVSQSGGVDFGIEDITLYAENCLAPTGKLNASETNLCQDDCIDFTDQSSGSPTAWQWIFPGGSPGTSTVQNPTGICYHTPGI